MSAPKDKRPDRGEWERDLLSRATGFTAVVVRGQGARDRADALTHERAKEVGAQMAADSGRKAMIYAVDPEGRSALVGVVTPAGTYTNAVQERG